LDQSIFHRLSSFFWAVIVVLVVLLAVYVSAGRLLVSAARHYQSEILFQLQQRIPVEIDADQVRGEWHGFTPEVVLEGLRLTVPGSTEHTLQLAGGRIGLDPGASLRTLSLQADRLRLDGLALTAELTASGQLRLRGFAAGDGELEPWLRELLLNARSITLADARLELLLPGGHSHSFQLDLQLVREGSVRRLEGMLESAEGLTLKVAGTGLGDPFRPETFSGELYAVLGIADLAVPAELLAGFTQGVAVEGAAELSLWAGWERGRSTVTARVTGKSLRIAPGDRAWELPLALLDVTARLEDHDRYRSLFLQDLTLADGEVLARVPRLQLDTWGETLRLRAAGLALGPVVALARAVGPLPGPVRELLGELDPAGNIDRLQLSVSDSSAPLRDWELEANFRDLTVNSWHGAPGVTSARGHLVLAPGGGTVMLDSQPFSLSFPTIYREPLVYSDFQGSFDIRWDERSVAVSSGLVTARGEEGTARVLFGLQIPLAASDTGIEMDLLVGLADSRTAYRDKYIPKVLNAGLLKWLGDSIGPGVVEQGAFLWRGSLNSERSDLHTVQLFFNIADTQLTYHPLWPPLSGLEGTLLIDDSEVSVWSGGATLLESRVEALSVETAVNDRGQLLLAVDGSIEGPAADGLAMVNGPVLGPLVENALDSYRLEGALASHLGLLLDLSDDQVPARVELRARLRDATLQMEPGDLTLDAINGTLDYSTDGGFTTRDMTASLWGEPLTLRVGDSPGGAVQIDAVTTVDMQDLRHWLRQDALALARGRTPVTLDLQLGGGAPPRLAISSNLAGVDLDLPEPWAKTADEERALRVRATLDGADTPVDVELAGDLTLRLDLGSTGLRGAFLALGVEPGPIMAGRLRVTGSATLIDLDRWGELFDRYFSPGASAAAADAAPREALSVAIEGLQTDHLRWRGNDLGPATIAAQQMPGGWWLGAESGWVAGELRAGDAGGALRLKISRLDLSALPDLELSAEDGTAVVVPDTDVSLAGLSQGARPLGQLAFRLHSEGDRLHATGITGELAGLRLTPEAPGTLSWQQGAAPFTEFTGTLDFEDLGQTLQRFGYERILETRQGRFGLALGWPGAPQDFSLEQAQGSVRVDIGQGQFLDASGATSGTLRVVSILNLAEIVRRLSLSHMFEAGIPFNEVKGDLSLQGGVIDIPSLTVQGSASAFEFDGEADVARETLDGELVVTLPVASNLPWVAALTAGLPVAAGVFVLSKLFEAQVNRLSSAVYVTSGTWDDPQVRFDRIFDDASHGAASPAVTPPATQPDSP